MKWIFALIFLSFLSFTGGAQDTISKIDPKDYICCGTTVDKLPEFPGGLEKFKLYIRKNLRWPGGGYDDTEGRVIVTFIVETSGKLTHIRVAKSLSPQKDKEAIRLIKKSPKWKPAIEKGKTKQFQYFVPINFTRESD